MAARKSRARTPKVWMGAFSFTEKNERAGSFQMIGVATGPTSAAKLFRERLRFIRRTTTMFKGTIRIYCDSLVEMTADFIPVATLVNYTSRRDTEGSIELYAAVPEQPDAIVRLYQLDQRSMNRPFLFFRLKEKKPFRASKKQIEAALARLRAVRGTSAD